MQFLAKTGTASTIKTDAVVWFTAQAEKLSGALKGLDAACGGALSDMFLSGEFRGKEGEVAVLFRPQGYAAVKVFVAGLGESRAVTGDSIRRACGNLSRHRSFTACGSAAVALEKRTDGDTVAAIVEGFLLGSYVLEDYKSEKAPKHKSGPTRITLLAESSKAISSMQRGVDRGTIMAEGQLLVRRLASLPSNDLTPKLYAGTIAELARKYRLHCRILDERQIAAEKMGLLLAVARGSEEPPRFVILEYKGRRDKQKPIVLVGKGVTFDSGGISIKPAENMHEMKGDMTGSAVVLATVIAAARLKLPLHVVALMPLTENMPSGKATKPGDIIRSRKGKTVEIINTDAEGRLILGDALDYANTFKPQAVVDIATLTGAALFVLGYAGAPFLANNKKLADQIRAAADRTGERVWEMPLWDDYRDAMKSSIADLVNSGGRPAGTLTATAFLESFIGDYPWAHIDIAYVDTEPKGKPYIPKGVTGIGARLLTQMLINWKSVK